MMVSERIAKKIQESLHKKRDKLKKQVKKIKTKPYITLKNFKRKGFFENLDLNLYEGEVLGIGGLLGSGRTELLRTIVGLDKKDKGDIYIEDKKVIINSPMDSLKKGIAYVTEDRRKEGLFYQQGIVTNISISGLLHVKKLMNFIDLRQEKTKVLDIVNNLDVRYKSIDQLAMNLSGGNQQKIILARWLFSNAKVILFDEPTVGVDVGAKEEIHELIEELSDLGKVIICVCTEIPELFRVSDKIVVLNKQGVLSERFSVLTTNEKEIRNKIIA